MEVALRPNEPSAFESYWISVEESLDSLTNRP